MIGIPRRRFLAVIAGAAGACLLPHRALTRQEGLKDVLVIGAGAAGLAANHALRRAGLSTLILEARERIGGRIWTNSRGVDLGASWVHGQRGNPVMDWVAETQSPTFRFNYNNHWRYDAEGDLSAAADKLIDRDFATLGRAIRRGQRRAPVSAALADVIDPFLARYPAPRQNGLRYAVNTSIIHEYASDPSQLSLRYYDAGKWQRGGDLLFPDGYAGVLQAVAPGEELLTGQVVRQISWSQNRVSVVTNRGEFTGRAAVVTLPLGVLKADRVKFLPDLPVPHRQAIDRLGFGVLNKLILRFPKVRWPAKPHLFGFVGTDGWWEEWVNFIPVNGQPVLMGFNGGQVAGRSETMTDRALAASAMEVLRHMFGRNLPDPVEITATRWKADPFARGAYSYYSPQSRPRDREALASPVSESLIFAGEACSTAHPATVHGALSSGTSAARQLIRQLNLR